MYRTILSALVFLLGAALFIGGIWLAALGGSWFYILLSAALVVCAILLFIRRPGGLALYGLTVLVTLAWALWEVGFDWWALSARGSLLIVLGILLLLPPMVRSLHRPGVAWARYDGASGVLAASLVIGAIVGVYAMFQTPHDLAGSVPGDRMTASRDQARIDVPDSEWPTYGRTEAGDRYLPLDQITPDNVGQLKVAWTYHTGDIRGPKDPGEATYEVTPLIDNTVYICTPHSLVIALDSVTGKEKWRFDPHLKQTIRQTTQHPTCRGVSHFDDAAGTTRQAQKRTSTRHGATSATLSRSSSQTNVQTNPEDCLAVFGKNATPCAGLLS